MATITINCENSSLPTLLLVRQKPESSIDQDEYSIIHIAERFGWTFLQANMQTEEEITNDKL